MSEQFLDAIALLCVLGAAVLSVSAGIGLLRFPDVLTRLHAVTKPQIFGVLLVIAAVAIDQRSWVTLMALAPVFVFQSLTAPVVAHMVARSSYRTGRFARDNLIIDQLKPAIERAKDAHASAEEDASPSAP